MRSIVEVTVLDAGPLRLKHSKKNPNNGTKTPGRNAHKKPPRDTPKTPKINPWTDHPGTRDGPTLNPGWGHPDPDLGLWMGHPESRGQSQTPYFVGFEVAHPELEVGFGMAPSRVRGGPVLGPGVVGPGVVFGGVSREVFVGVSAGCFSAIVRVSFLSVSAFLSGPRQV